MLVGQYFHLFLISFCSSFNKLWWATTMIYHQKILQHNNLRNFGNCGQHICHEREQLQKCIHQLHVILQYGYPPRLSGPSMVNVKASVRLEIGSDTPYDRTSAVRSNRNRWVNIPEWPSVSSWITEGRGDIWWLVTSTASLLYPKCQLGRYCLVGDKKAHFM